MNNDVKDIAEWARSQGWTVLDDTKGYSRFYDPQGNYVTYYPASPSRPNRRMADLKVDLKKAGKPDPEPNSMAIKRGTVQQFDGHSGLLWTRGPAQVGVDGKWFSPDGKSLPKPLIFTRHTGSGDFNLLAADILALTKLDWVASIKVVYESDLISGTGVS
mgnify:CR=1 FL=1